MNYRMILYVIGKILKIEAAVLALPLVVSLIYQEEVWTAFLVPILLLLLFGFTITHWTPKNKSIYAKEGFIIVALTWLLMSVFGALPFYLSGEIPSYIDAFFETVSGFTTTGSSILSDVEALSNGMLFWRSFTHWIGGMGVLVFVLAILPQTDTQSIYLMKAEVPGPTVGKLVSKLKLTARILYGIYVVLTAVEVILLILGGMPVFDSLLTSFGTAGTGGFGIKNNSIAFYQSAYIDYVVGIFMVIFGINFNIFYFILIRKFSQAFKNEELRCYLGIILASTAMIAVNIYSLYQNVGDSIRHAFFQVSSIITTTGFSTVDFNQWPRFSQAILVLLMFCGACGGSTGGGIKVSRVIILVKTAFWETRKMISPRSVSTVKMEGKPVDKSVLRGTYAYFTCYVLLLAFSVLLLSLENFDFTTTATAAISCINNIGPGLNLVGPMENFSVFSPFSTLILSFDMLAGRLEIFPMLMLFSPSLWRVKSH